MSGKPFTFVSVGGKPVTEVNEGGIPFIEVDVGGQPVTAVAVGGIPVTRTNAIITATTAPSLAALAPGDTLSAAVTWGSYQSSQGTISGTVREMSVNGAAFVAYAPATVVGDADTYQLRETVTDSEGNERIFTTATVTVMYAAGSVTESALADWTIDDDVINISFVSDFTTTNLTGSYVVAGLPSGVVDDGDGTISGTATGTAAAVNFTVTFTDQYGRTIVGNYSVNTVYRTQATAASGLGPFSYEQDTAISTVDFSSDFTANGNTLTYSAVSVPTGLSVNSSGVMSGTPTAAAGDTTYTVRATDEYGRTTDTTFNAHVWDENKLFLLIGQSNMVGAATFDGGDNYPYMVRQWTQLGADAAATTLLDHVSGSVGNMGLAVEFAIDYMAANPTKRLVFVPYADGGTGFFANDWNPGDVLYEAAIAAANAAISSYGVSALAGVLWHQGENDAKNSVSEATYAAALDAMIADLRASVTGSTNVPFVVGEIGAFLSTGTYPTRDAIIAALNDTPNRVSFTSVVETGDLTDTGDSVHFNAASLRTMGSRYYTAWLQAAGDFAPVIQSNPTISGTEQVGQTLTATAGTVIGEPTPTRTWQWERGGVAISGATSSTYTLVSADQGSTLTVVQTETNTEGSDTAESSATGTIGDVPDAFVDADWSVATGSGNQAIDVTIASLPAANEAAITDVEYELDASGTWVSSGGTVSFTITAPAASTSYDVRLRAVNSFGNGAASNTETATSNVTVASALTITGVDYKYGGADTPTETITALTTSDGDAHLVIVYATGTINNALPTSVTLGGTACTLLAGAATGSEATCGIYYISSVSGTSNDVVITGGKSDFRGVTVMSLSGTATLDDSDTILTTAGSTMSLNVSADGLIVAAHSSRGTSNLNDFTFANGSSNVSDVSQSPATNVSQSAGSQEYASAVTGEVVTVNITGANGLVAVAVALS